MEKKNADFICLFSVVMFFLFTHVQEIGGATYYVDPATGHIDNAGDAGNPWSTLEEVFKKRKTFTAGDIIYLRSGFHGSPSVRGKNTDYVTILPQEGHNPTFEKVVVSGAAKWKLSGVTISPELAPQYEKTALISISSSAAEIVVENCFCYSVLDNSSWTMTDWSSGSCSGASITGDNNILRNNHFINVKHGILVENSAENNLITGNTVENFAADGMRGIGSYNTFEYNVVKNCFNVDDNHDDGFQSYSYGPDGVGKTTVYGIVLRGNTIINRTDPAQKYKGTLQGFGCFDGMFEDWVIENNVIITDHWHGISLYGAKNCRIVNNTVVDLNNSSPGPPWIRITAHKNGTKSTDNVVRNNLTTALSNDANVGEVDHNVIISQYSFYDNYFVDYDNFDLRLIEGCRAIDAGTAELAPTLDILGTARPQGEAIDAGAYEYNEDSTVRVGDVFQPRMLELCNYPNPFNPGTKISYKLDRESHVRLSIFNLLGTHIDTLVDELQDAGIHSVAFDAAHLPSGTYIFQVKAGDLTATRPMILCK